MEEVVRRRLWSVAALAAVLAYGWWAAGLRPFTAPALAVTLGTGGLVLAAGARAGWRRQRPAGEPSRETPTAGLGIWALLLLALAGWEMAAFLQLPRSEHPTLSSLANLAFESHPVRAAAFALWMAAGFGMARR